MSIEIARCDEPTRWNRYVEQSPDAGVSHRFEALEVQAEFADATLYPYVGYKGQEPIGLFPVFAIRKGPIQTAFSPPPSLRVPYLGPAFLHMGKLTQRKTERRQRQFVDGVLGAIDEEIVPRYVHLRVDNRYPDLRPFIWEEFRAHPNYTYVVDLAEGRDDLLAAFSRDARTNITNTDPDTYEIELAGADGVREILQQVRERFEFQGLDFDVPTAFGVRLYERLPAGAVRPYVCYVDGEFASGILAIDDGKTVYRWQGGVRTDGYDPPVNDLLDWAIITDAIDRGREEYDLVGANNERVNSYKAKFAPESRTYHYLERGSILFSMLAQTYKRFS